MMQPHGSGTRQKPTEHRSNDSGPQSMLFPQCCISPATLLPYPADAGLRPVALRPALSSSLPLTDCRPMRNLDQN